jgi:hypothetical protein
VEAGSNTSTVPLRVVRGDENGSLESETVKYGRESHGTQTRKWLRWQGSAAIVNYRPVLSSDIALHVFVTSTFQIRVYVFLKQPNLGRHYYTGEYIWATVIIVISEAKSKRLKYRMLLFFRTLEYTTYFHIDLLCAKFFRYFGFSRLSFIQNKVELGYNVIEGT